MLRLYDEQLVCVIEIFVFLELCGGSFLHIRITKVVGQLIRSDFRSDTDLPS